MAREARGGVRARDSMVSAASPARGTVRYRAPEFAKALRGTSLGNGYLSPVNLTPSGRLARFAEPLKSK